MLTRDRLCEAIGIKPEVYIDTLAWAMKNPSTPELVSPAESPVFDHMQEEVDLHSIAIPYHWPQDRGRYMSASVIIAEVNGQRNMSFHRQFLRDKNHLVVRLVPRHLRTMVDQARERGEEVNIAIVNAPILLCCLLVRCRLTNQSMNSPLLQHCMKTLRQATAIGRVTEWHPSSG